MKTTVWFSSFLAIAILGSTRATAESPTEARLRDALRASTQQLRALEDERTRWQATETAQKKEIESLKAELESQSRKLRAQGASSEVKRQLNEQTEANQKLTESLTQCQNAGRQAEEANRSKDAEREQVAAKQQAQLTLATNRANTCEEKNDRMYKLSHELVQRCGKMNVGDTLMAPLEPLTGLRRVKLENLSQEYEDKLQDEKVQP